MFSKIYKVTIGKENLSAFLQSAKKKNKIKQH